MYISKKVRKNKNECFCFMRFRFEQEAVRAVRKLNGLVISGSKLAISMERYQKGGVPVPANPVVDRAGGYGRSGIKRINHPSSETRGDNLRSFWGRNVCLQRRNGTKMLSLYSLRSMLLKT